MINKTYSITIFILSYNRPDFLSDALKSIANQSFSDLLVIICDNASDISFDDVIHKYTNIDIKYIKHKENLGSFGNFMFAWKYKKPSDFFMIFHDDDLLTYNYLEIAFKKLKLHSNLIWVASNFLGFKGLVPQSLNIESSANGKSFTKEELVLYLIQDKVNFCFSSVVYRTSCMKDVDLNTLVQQYGIIFDRPFLLTLLKEQRCFIFEDKNILYRNHSVQDSRVGNLSLLNIFNLLDFYCESIIKLGNRNYHNAFMRWSNYHFIRSIQRANDYEPKNFSSIIEKARKKELYNDILFTSYLYSNIINIYKRINTKLKKIFFSTS
jgi:glycosyltransferase involved in cell wall biosynthesis